MSAVVKWSVILGIAVAACNAIFLALGLHGSPVARMGFVGLAIVLNAAAVVMALRATASECTYGKQLLHGALIGVFGGILVFASSWLLLTVVFPNAIEEIRAGMAAVLQELPLSEDQRERQIAALEGITAAGEATSGLIGTFLTSAVLGAIAGAFLRRR